MTIYEEEQFVPSDDSYSSLFMELDTLSENEVLEKVLNEADTKKLASTSDLKDDRIQHSNGTYLPLVPPCTLAGNLWLEEDNQYVYERKTEQASRGECVSSFSENEKKEIIALKEALLTSTEEFQCCGLVNIVVPESNEILHPYRPSYTDPSLDNRQFVDRLQNQRSFAHMDNTGCRTKARFTSPNDQGSTNLRERSVESLKADYDDFTGETTVTIGGHRYAIDTHISMETTTLTKKSDVQDATIKTNFVTESGPACIQGHSAIKAISTIPAGQMPSWTEQFGLNNSNDSFNRKYSNSSLSDVLGRDLCTEELSRRFSESDVSFLESIVSCTPTSTTTEQSAQIQPYNHQICDDKVDLLDISYSNFKNQSEPSVYNDECTLSEDMSARKSSSSVHHNPHLTQKMPPRSLPDQFSQWTVGSVASTTSYTQSACALSTMSQSQTGSSIADPHLVDTTLSWTGTVPASFPGKLQPPYCIENHSAVSSTSDPVHSPKRGKRHCQSPVDDRGTRSPKEGSPRFLKPGCRLWEFIRNLLLEPATNPSVICWEDRSQGVFRLVRPKEIARIWGQKKGNEAMSYEKLSRAMRYYYKRGIFEPVLGKRLLYKFGPKATGWREGEV